MSRAQAVAVLAGMAATLLLVATARVPEAGAGWRAAFVAVYLAAAAASAWYVWRTPLGAPAVLLGALAFRLCALPMLPTLSDDGYRYLWDGRLTAEAGVSPYRYRPSDPALSTWHDRPEYRRMNSRDYYSVYPPVGQLAFAAAVWAAPGDGWKSAWWTWKALVVAAELAAVVLLLRVVRPEAVAVYAWSPLAVVEVAGQGHTEALVLLGVAVALAASRRREGGRRWPLASLGLTVAGAVKLYPLALLPLAWRRDGWAGVALSGGVLAATSALFASPDAVAHVGESLGLFFGTFDQYAAPYRTAKALLYPALGAEAGRWASRLLSACFAAGAALAWLADDGSAERLRWTVAAVAVGFLVTATTLHPWYWLPALFLSPLLRSKKPVVWLSLLSSASYLGYTTPALDIPVLVVGWGGALALAWATRPGATARPPGERAPPSPWPRPATARRGSGGTT